MLATLLPVDQPVSFTGRVFGFLLVLGLVLALLGWLAKAGWLRRLGLFLGAGIALCWVLLIVTRPPWLKVAMRPTVPIPTASSPQWTSRSNGLETAQLDLTVDGDTVDHLYLSRLEPKRFAFQVHWDPRGRRTAEDWQKELGAAVVVNGSYFMPDRSPLTPLRIHGTAAGPKSYSSIHGAFVASNGQVNIIDLRNQDVFAAISNWPEAMVSYPLLVDPQGQSRAVGDKEWLAARNFVALDSAGRVLLGTTETGFFTLRRLALFLPTAGLDIKLALNFDGGPLVSQVIQADGWERHIHGKAEVTDGWDVLRLFWQAHVERPWKLPIVLAAVPREAK